MAARKIYRGEWDQFCSFASRYALGKRAHIETLSLHKGSRLEVDGVPIQGFFFDSDRDVIELWAAENPYRIHRPREIYADDVMAGLPHFAVIDSEGVRHIVVIREPISIAGPQENSQSGHLDQAFIELQYRYLVRLHEELVADVQELEMDERDLNRQKRGAAAELEDDGQRLAQLEIDGILVARDLTRLDRVRRALQKIAEHTYGLSDSSGQSISRARLEAVPEAILTLAEELASESATPGSDASLSGEIDLHQ